MSGNLSCKQCGCSEIDTDPARGDAVCTNCGCVLEQSIIVSEVTFEEDGHGGASAIGQFVSAESRGGGTMSGVSGGGFHTSVGKESKEITLRNAKKKINEVAQQLRLNQHCIDVAFNFFKMALHKQLTKGRKTSLTIAACIYMTCRIEGTPHLLIDFSDVLQMDVYALGRAYVQISRSLYINIPAVDPCMYILRFAHKFDLEEKTHDVAMTALRLVQRMKRDWIHLGRRPSGLCGAALLISARLYGFSRSVQDVIAVVKVHETTLRKRLVEFGETSSSSLTLDEFMSVDLEEEHDPPSYKAARIKDRERLQKLLESEVSEEFKKLQARIDDELDRRRKKLMSKSGSASPARSVSRCSSSASPTRDNNVAENDVETNFIMESTLSTISSIIEEPIKINKTEKGTEEIDRILMPPPPVSTTMPTANVLDIHLNLLPEKSKEVEEQPKVNSGDGELDLEGIDDNEINGYLMSVVEVQKKTVMWEKLNHDYIESQRLKQEQYEKDLKEGKVDKKKKKRGSAAKSTFQAKSANEAIKIMLKERKVSSKINYDVLRSLTDSALDGMDGNEDEASTTPTAPPLSSEVIIESGPVLPASKRKLILQAKIEIKPKPAKKAKKSSRKRSDSTSSASNSEVSEPEVERKPIKTRLDSEPTEEIEEIPTKEAEPEIVTETATIEEHEDEDEYYDDEEEVEDESSLSAQLKKFRGEQDDDDDYYD